ncbi:MAG: thiamine-phosphate kinase [Candidatus Aminicenantes bacterium]|nr:MAG: thiamine-phosphate kinase [Candidatus Aminicenantes bacterium]RLE03102.1 MAG: thiamine-phosphate kinase [Candidatus Aminicenantes bacterium]
MKIREFTEAQLINFLHDEFAAASPEVTLGIGDDTAVIHQDDGYWLLTKDLLLENVHFRLAFHPPFLLGRKSLNVNISDIAAMGGRPAWALLGLGIPKKVNLAWLKEFLAGFKAAAREAGVELVGGDLSRSSHLFISVSLIGETKSPVFRAGAKPGEFIYVSGALGEAALGWQLLKKGHRLGETPELENCLQRFLDPTPQLSLAQELVTHDFVSAMIDLSDGLAEDIRHLCQASKCGAEIWSDKVPLSPCLKRWAARPMKLALHGGEDYQLLFTIKQARERSFLAWLNKSRYQLHRVGQIIKEKEVFLLRQGGRRQVLNPQGFRHFG